QRGLVDPALGAVDRDLRAVDVRAGLGDLLRGLRVQVGLLAELRGLDVALRGRHLRLGRVDRLLVVEQRVLLVLLRGGDGLLVGLQRRGARVPGVGERVLLAGAVVAAGTRTGARDAGRGRRDRKSVV